MNHIKEYFKKNWPYFCAFFLPFFIMFFVYLMYGIYWNSETSPLLGDGFHQYVIFDTNLRNILHGTDSIFYTFSSGLGQNFYALSSYYLGSFLSPLVYFFDLKSMPDAVYLFTLIKFGLIGLSAFISVKGMAGLRLHIHKYQSPIEHCGHCQVGPTGGKSLEPTLS